jgi:Immunity protein 26
MKKYHINMEFLGVSRKKPQVGDVFVFKNKYLGYVYGRVILGEDWQGPMSKGEDFMFYIYNHITSEIEKNPKLDKHNLLIDPFFSNRRGWLDGYFKTISSNPLQKSDVLEQHCFRRSLKNDPELWFVDENGKTIGERIEPCGSWGSSNHRKIDDLISEKMNLPFAELTETDGSMPKKIKWW